MAPRTVAGGSGHGRRCRACRERFHSLLTVLETLGPVERAVFVLHEVFETPYDEIAEVVGKTPAAVRQIAHRAREHVAERRPQMLVDRAQQEAVLESFMAAITSRSSRDRGFDRARSSSPPRRAPSEVSRGRFQ